MASENSSPVVKVVSNVMYVDFTRSLVMPLEQVCARLRLEQARWEELRLIANTTKVGTLVDLLSRYEKTYAGGHRIRPYSKDLPKLIQCAAKAAIEGFEMGDLNLATVACNLVSINSKLVLPDERLMQKFGQILDMQMRHGGVVGAHEGQTAGGLHARAGNQEVASRYLRYLLSEPTLREGEWRKLRAYYGSEGGLYRACDRHHREYAGRVFQVWLLPSLMVDLEIVSLERLRQATVPTTQAKLTALARFDAKLARELDQEMSGIVRRRSA